MLPDPACRDAYTEGLAKTRLCDPLTLAYHPPGEPHAQTILDSPVSSFNVEIGTECMNRIREFYGPIERWSSTAEKLQTWPAVIRRVRKW